MWPLWFWPALLLLLGPAHRVDGHGRLVDPPSRATAWRYGFATPENFNDNELYCGGWSRQHQTNKGRCGVCGDPYDTPQPRLHENGGKYGLGVITRTYKMDADVDLGVDLTANHQGYFEFRLCPLNDDPAPETEECFDQYVLQRSDGQGPRYFPAAGTGVTMTSSYKLPTGLLCERCVLQWRYVAGNNWGTCANGTGHNGCGPQEQFRACADVRITDQEFVDTVPVPTSTTARPTSSTAASTTTTVSSARPGTTSQPWTGPRTRGTVTMRITKKKTTTTTTTPAPPPTTTTTPVDAGAAAAPPGPYVGVIIALATLLFAILLVGGVILYFYGGHQKVKDVLRRRFQTSPAVAAAASAGSPPTPARLPASVLALHAPQRLTSPNEKRKAPPPPAPVRHSSLTISEPLDVTINGVSVARDRPPRL